LCGFGGKISERASAAFALRGLLTLGVAFALALTRSLGLAFAFAFPTERAGAERLAAFGADFGFGRAGFTLGRAARAAAFFLGFFEFLGIPITRLEVVTINTVRYRNTVFKCIALPVLLRALSRWSG
jgi:hypothetical protein